MEIKNEIKQLTLSFFETINSKIIENNRAYHISLPENYHNYFGKGEMSITFDEEVASEQNCELIIPGSRILFQIITNCINKGPITLKRSKSPNDELAIRYHFYVNFSSSFHNSQLFQIDVDLKTLKPIKITEDLETDMSQNKFVPHEQITSSYNIALDELKSKSDEIKLDLMKKTNDSFQADLKLFISKYDSEIRELDQSINDKERSSNNFEEVQKFRFDTLDKIQNLENEKSHLIDTLQEKYKIILDYELIACEIILI